jgi:hypothetical protein
LPIGYFHVAYTLPAELRDVAWQNKRGVYDLLMKAAAETTIEIAADSKRLGARFGITSVLHTWGSAMTHHPHVHMTVPGGGLSPDGMRWVTSRASFLVHVHVLAREFRGKPLAMQMDANAAGSLKFFNTHSGLADSAAFKRFLGPLRHVKWVVNCKGAVHWPRGGAAPSLTLHAPHRDLEPSAHLGRRWRCRVQVEGLSGRRAGALENDDAGASRVHQAVPDPRAAKGLPPHPS